MELLLGKGGTRRGGIDSFLRFGTMTPMPHFPAIAIDISMSKSCLVQLRGFTETTNSHMSNATKSCNVDPFLGPVQRTFSRARHQPKKRNRVKCGNLRESGRL